jgi:prephenate dehydrogenase
MRSFDSAAIIGLGLIGGSLARDLAGCGVHVLAYDANDEYLASAIQDGVVHDALDSSLTGVAAAEVIVVAVPVDAAIDVLRRLAPHAGSATLITDVGSTKVRIVDVATDVGLGDRFVGSHPMAGGHRSGWAASSAGLFSGAPVYLCPTSVSADSARQLANEFWTEIGGRTMCMDAEQHDQQLAWTSHLPHIVSTALALALSRSGISRGDLGPGGRDVTRLAGSSADVWTAIAHDNAAAIDGALAAAEAEIAMFRQAIGASDTRALHERFSAARVWFDERPAPR